MTVEHGVRNILVENDIIFLEIKFWTSAVRFI